MGRHVRAVCPIAPYSAGEHRNARRYGPKKKIRRDVGSGVMCGLFEFFFFSGFPPHIFNALLFFFLLLQVYIEEEEEGRQRKKRILGFLIYGLWAGFLIYWLWAD
ncbi:hypothetical protein Hanom_Chr01g00044761 [Helianthus anomalus]